MSEHVIAIDPGGRTGWASGRMDVDRLELTGWGVLPQREFALWLAKQQNVKGPPIDGPVPHEYDVLVTESWRPRRQNGSMDWIEGDPLLSAQHVGQIRMIAWLSAAKYVEQQPSDKTTWTATLHPVLQELDRRSSEQHDQDARWHLWGYFFTNWFTASKDADVLLPS